MFEPMCPFDNTHAFDQRQVASFLFVHLVIVVLKKPIMNKFTYQNILDSKCTNVIEIGKFRNKGSLVGHYIEFWFELESNRLKNDRAENIIYNWEEAQQLSISYDGTPTVQELLQESKSNGLPFDSNTNNDLPF